MNTKHQGHATSASGGSALLAAVLSLFARSADDIARVGIRRADDIGRACVAGSDDLGVLVTRSSDDFVRYADDSVLRAQSDNVVGTGRFRSSLLVEPDDRASMTSRVRQEALKEGVKSLGRLEREDD